MKIVKHKLNNKKMLVLEENEMTKLLSSGALSGYYKKTTYDCRYEVNGEYKIGKFFKDEFI